MRDFSTFDYARRLVENALYLLMTIGWILFDAIWHIYARGTAAIFPKQEEEALGQLDRATNYREWRQWAEYIDKLNSTEQYLDDPVSTNYDYKMISHRLMMLRRTREVKDILSLIRNLRSGLLRNLGNITDVRLYVRSLVSTKRLIHEYLDEIVFSFEFIAQQESLSLQQKLEFYADTRQSFGNTALLLHGGATFGMYHLGVVKCLYEQSLLPRIFCGTSVGALVAALICVREDDEIPEVLSGAGIRIGAFNKIGEKGSIRRKAARLLKTGHLLDVHVLEECARENIGDLTFEEAFVKSRRILNIIVSSSKKNEVPRLLNYLTAPNVLVRTAALASCAGSGLYDSLPLLAKDSKGNVSPYHKQKIEWRDVSMDDGPSMRLAELFNVNHIILSQANPYLLPFVRDTHLSSQSRKSDFMRKIRTIIHLEVTHRMQQLNQLGILPYFLRGFVDSTVTGHITITPHVTFKVITDCQFHIVQDYKLVYQNPSVENIDHWILKGEKATWPQVALIKCRLQIELALDRILLKLRSQKS